MYRQYKFKKDEKEIVCWLKDNSKIKINTKISFKNDKDIWTCIERYDVLLEEKPLTDWDNNI